MIDTTQHTNPNSNEQLLLTIEEARLQLRISRWLLYKLIHARQLTTIRIGSRRFITPAALHQLLAQLGQVEAD